MEIYKYIKGYPDYKVSNLGNVKSYKHGKVKILKNNKSCGGYLAVGLCKQGKSQTILVHKLVAIEFLNHIPNFFEIVIDHIDNNKLNNKLDNLQLITHRENTSKDRKNYSSKYTGVSWHKLKSKWRSDIRIKGKTIRLGLFETEKEASDKYKLALLNIDNIYSVIKKPVFSSKYKGVYWEKRSDKWLSRITIDGKVKQVGIFTNELEAYKARQLALSKIKN